MESRWPQPWPTLAPPIPLPQLQPVFVRPPSSRPIPIVDPTLKPPTKSGPKKPKKKQQQNTPLAEVQNPQPRASRRATAAAARPKDEAPAQTLDIYARPFVPEAWTIINTLPGLAIDTPSSREINFGKYMRSFLGREVLDVLPAAEEKYMDNSLSLNDSIAYELYESYFRFHLVQEFRSQELENASCSLYGHHIKLLSHDQQPTVCSFEVPGLRENHPYIEEDDVIQIRQLRYDHEGRLFGMEQWLAPQTQAASFSNPYLPARWRGEPAPGWGGIIYNARASVVQRKEERLIVRIGGSEDIRIPGLAYGSNTFMLPHLPSLKFNIQFLVPRERYFPMFQALSMVRKDLRYGEDTRTRPWLRSMLFPTETDTELQTTLNPGVFNRTFFDEQLNWEQKKTVESICLHNYGTLPFLISGPPGTGKTKTLVEIALQLIKKVNGVQHIIFCAPSDPAADTIVQRISSYFSGSELFRLNRPSRTFAEVPGSVLPYCHVTGDTFDLPPFKQLMSYKLVVTTCRDASLLLYARLTNSDLYTIEYGFRNSIHPFDADPLPVRLHWTALIMDESAQAMEPEAVIPLAIVAPPLDCPTLEFKPLFVMAGDEYQLGPRTSLRTSPLKISLFARLFARSVYANHPLARGKSGIAPPPLKIGMLPIDRPAFANLIRNYRSHPAILAVPSSLFYGDTLEPEATDTDRLAGWSEWQGKKWPVLFRNNDSNDELEQDGGGWYNVMEAIIACQYAAKLVETGKVAQNEICIMSPFKSQVQCLRKTVRKPEYGALWDIDIGPTEAFQGLERGVVILCTTRSRQRYVESDKEGDWGIIGLPKKMNVALTRAKFGLIVIGKGEILRTDPDWKAFLDFCTRNGLVSDAADIPGAGATAFQQVTRLEKVLLARERDTQLDESGVLRGVTGGENDEMWTQGIREALDGDGENEDFDNYDGEGEEEQYEEVEYEEEQYEVRG